MSNPMHSTAEASGSIQASDAEYCELSGDAAVTTAVAVEPNAVYTTAYVVVPKEPRKRQQCGGMACAMCCLLFLLLFFLIPRSPGVYFEELYVERNTVGNFTEYGTFKFRNYNFYSMSWTDLKIECDWLTDVDYSDLDCDTTTYRGTTYCAYRMGEFQRSQKFSTDAQSHSYEDIQLVNSDGDEHKATTRMATSCFTGEKQLIKTSGTVHGKSDSHNYGKIHVSSTYYYLYC